MVEMHSGSDSEELDSDEELQVAFEKGFLKTEGLNVVLPAPAPNINNVAGINQKLKEFSRKLDWVERLDVTNEPAAAPAGAEELQAEEDANNDFVRELRFYRQAQATVMEAIPKLHKLGIKTKRPEDYFAEMAKSDGHMKKVREKLLERQQNMEQREKARKLRDLRKYGKKVQQEVLIKRQKEKKEMLDAVKKFRKGQKDKLDFLDDGSKKKGGKPQKGPAGQGSKVQQPNKRRQFKNTKFGFGGQKKRSKSNTAESAGDMGDFSIRQNQGRPGMKKKLTNKNKKNKRPGKSKRVSSKNKK